MRTAIVFNGLLAVAPAITSTACNEPGCIQIEHPPVTDLQTPLLIGGTYGEALTTIVGMRSGPMQWRAIDPPFEVDDLPAPGETQLTVTVHEPSMAEQLEFEKGRVARNERLACDPPGLFAELEIELRSDDGLLDARLPAIVTWDTPAEASIFARDIHEQDLGALELTPPDPGAKLWLQISYYAYEEPPRAQGSMTLHWSSSDGDGSGAGWSDELAIWTLGGE